MYKVIGLKSMHNYISKIVRSIDHYFYSTLESLYASNKDRRHENSENKHFTKDNKVSTRWQSKTTHEGTRRRPYYACSADNNRWRNFFFCVNGKRTNTN